MTTCVNFGDNCVGCDAYFGYCIDDRRCTGKCHACINNDCDNHPQVVERLGYAEELYA